MLAALGKMKLSPAEGGSKERLQARAVHEWASQQLRCLVGQYSNPYNTEGHTVVPSTQHHPQCDQVMR